MKTFKFAFCVGIVGVFVANAMDNEYDYKIMYENTSRATPIKEISTTALSLGEISDETAIREAAFSGDYVAQYLLAQQAGGRARLAYNGEKKALLKEKAFYLLISAIRGGYWKSINEINAVLESELESSDRSFSDIQKLVNSIYENL